MKLLKVICKVVVGLSSCCGCVKLLWVCQVIVGLSSYCGFVKLLGVCQVIVGVSSYCGCVKLLWMCQIIVGQKITKARPFALLQLQQNRLFPMIFRHCERLSFFLGNCFWRLSGFFSHLLPTSVLGLIEELISIP